MKRSPLGTLALFWIISVRKEDSTDFLVYLVCVFSSFKFYLCIPDNYRAAELCAERKSRLRCKVPVDYDEKEVREPKRSRPKTEYAKLKQKIFGTIEHMSKLNMELCVHDRLWDKISIADVEEIQELLDDSDSDDEVPVDLYQNQFDSSRSDEASAVQNLKVDKDFSLEYGFTTDVSGLRIVNSIYQLFLIFPYDCRNSTTVNILTAASNYVCRWSINWNNGTTRKRPSITMKN